MEDEPFSLSRLQTTEAESLMFCLPVQLPLSPWIRQVNWKTKRDGTTPQNNAPNASASTTDINILKICNRLN